MDKTNKIIGLTEDYMTSRENEQLYALSNKVAKNGKQFENSINRLTDHLQEPIDYSNKNKVNRLLEEYSKQIIRIV